MAATGVVVLVIAVFHVVHPIRNGLPIKSIPRRPMTTPALFRKNPPEPNQVSFYVKRRTAAVELPGITMGRQWPNANSRISITPVRTCC